jgi:EAL domain-containing protein (putative c-di-GMP-specific phosphodiesterase class I)
MKNADAALHKALDLGQNRFLVFDRSITEAFREYMTVENGLHSALSDNEFKLYYQPQVNCATGKICGFEALLRWERPDGIVPPNRFIKIAEESGLIVPIGLWVIDEACRFANEIHRRGGTDVSISLNISTLQLVQSDFTEKVNNILDSTGVDRSTIGFEITESAFMQSFETNVEKLEKIKRSGIEIHLDDFGTGYSSLSYLKRLPIDVVKIDKSFVDDVAAGEGKKDLTGPIVALRTRWVSK